MSTGFHLLLKKDILSVNTCVVFSSIAASLQKRENIESVSSYLYGQFFEVCRCLVPVSKSRTVLKKRPHTHSSSVKYETSVEQKSRCLCQRTQKQINTILYLTSMGIRTNSTRLVKILTGHITKHISEVILVFY